MASMITGVTDPVIIRSQVFNCASRAPERFEGQATASSGCTITATPSTLAFSLSSIRTRLLNTAKPNASKSGCAGRPCERNHRRSAWAFLVPRRRRTSFLRFRWPERRRRLDRLPSLSCIRPHRRSCAEGRQSRIRRPDCRNRRRLSSCLCNHRPDIIRP